MNAERIEELRERIREGLVVIAGDAQDVSDIILIVREKAEQIKAGDSRLNHRTVHCENVEDERAKTLKEVA